MPPLNKEDLQRFLSERFPDSAIRFIGEGWSSVAFQADDKIIRFPRTTLREYIKERDICDFIRQRISFQIPDISIAEDAEYPYAVHRAVPGEPYSSKYRRGLDAAARDLLAADYAKFLAELHAIDAKEIAGKVPMSRPEVCYPDFSYPKFGKIAPFLTPYFSNDKLRTLQDIYERAIGAKTEDFVLCHRDVSGRNSTLDKNNRLAGVFDWGFAGIYERAQEFVQLTDFKQVEFLDQILREYRNITGVEIDKGRVMDLCAVDALRAAYERNTAEHLKGLDEKMEWPVARLGAIVEFKD